MIKKNINNDILIIVLFLLFFATRPLIDLQGSYKDGAINLGGIVGITSAGIAIASFFLSRNARAIILQPFFYLLIPIFIFGLIFLIISERPNETALEFARFIAGFSFIVPLYLILNLRIHDKYLKIAFKIFSFSLFVPIFIGWMQYLGYYPYSFYDYYDGQPIGRVSGGYFQPSSLTRYLIFFMIFSMCMRKINFLNKNIFYLIFLFSSATIFITGHRASILAMVIILPIFYYGIYNKFPKFNKRIALFSIVIIIFTFLYFVLSESFAKSILNSVALTFNTIIKSFSISLDSSFMRGRGELWIMAVDQITSSDLVNLIFGFSYTKFEVHNDPLRIFLTYGILGFVLFSLFFYNLFKFCNKKIASKNSFALMSVYLFLAMASVTLEPTAYPNFMWLFFITPAFIRLAINEKKYFNNYENSNLKYN